MKQVELDKSGIKIDGKQTILLCASLFYFRIPRAEWEDRIQKLKASGYNCVDVYFPWNYHETQPGKWDFTGEKDAAAFLNLLSANGIYVIARPGPYICSEWDGGAVPAWVLTNADLKIRDNDPGWLAAVQQWYDRILPIIAEHQITCGGTVVMMQLENELDFYDCSNPRAYMTALYRMARDKKIEVPLFGCAGQGSVENATGWADDVDVSFNFYGDECSPEFSEKFRYYAARMESLNKPLLVSETSCDHLLLRRELASGAKLLGPYNQVGGTNFGFMGSQNNWGTRERPGSFITTYYSGDNMIGPAGELFPQYFEGRCFAGLIHTFGEALARAESVEEQHLSVSCGFVSERHFSSLQLGASGRLLCIPNLGTEDGTAAVTQDGTVHSVFVPAHQAPFFPVDISLKLFGGHGVLHFADAELENVRWEKNTLVLTLRTESPSPYASFEQSGKTFCLTREAPEKNGIRVVFVGKEKLPELPLAGVILPPSSKCTQLKAAASLRHAVQLQGDWSKTLPYAAASVQPLEKLDVYRGCGSYRLPVKGEGLYLLGGSDLMCTYRDGVFLGAAADSGAAHFFAGSGTYCVNVFIWGHSNFADARLPALMLNASRGITAAADIEKRDILEQNWFFSYFEGALPDSLRVPQRAVETVVSINAWNTTRTPLKAVYRKSVRLAAHCSSFLLEFQKPSAEVTVYVDGQRVGLVNPLDPVVDISAFVCGKSEAELELAVLKRDWNEPVGVPVLYAGHWIETDEFLALPEERMTQLANQPAEHTAAVQLPLPLQAGTRSLLEFELPDIAPQSAYLRVGGKNLLLTAWVGETLLGRVLLWEQAPVMCGKKELLYLPASWLCGHKTMRVFVQSLGPDSFLSDIAAETLL